MSWEQPPPPRARRSAGPAVVGLAVVLALLVAAALYSPGDQWQMLRRMTGLEQRPGEPPTGKTRGPHAFVLTQKGSSEPVGYDPCRPIRYRINPAQAPDDYRTYVDTAVARVSEATGLVFEYDGTTGSRSFFRRTSGRPPVVVAWATEEEVPELADDVAGVAGSVAVETSFGRREYVTGWVVLDADAFSSFFNGPRKLQAVVDHEFGHLVGLAHVKDHDQLMHPSASRTYRFAAGDLQGLRRLGRLPCG